MARRKQRKRARKRRSGKHKPAVWLAQASRQRFAPHLAFALGAVIALNLVVRTIGGGDAHPLSLRHLDHKGKAVALLALHGLKHLFGDDGPDPRALVSAAANAAGVPPGFAIRVAKAESGLRPHAISSTGAMGLMQLMPATAAAYGADDPFDPEQNARAATRYLRWLWDRYAGDRKRVLAAYNAGPARVPRQGTYRVPAETRGYVAKILD